MRIQRDQIEAWWAERNEVSAETWKVPLALTPRVVAHVMHDDEAGDWVAEGRLTQFSHIVRAHSEAGPLPALEELANALNRDA